jgi:hypothetical protein
MSPLRFRLDCGGPNYNVVRFAFHMLHGAREDLKDLANFGEEREDSVPNFNDVNRAENAALGVAKRFSRTT